MEMLLKNGFVYTDNDFIKADLLIKDGRIIDIAENIDVCCDVVYNLNNLYIFPGFTDVHVHLREPGFSHKTTVSQSKYNALSYCGNISAIKMRK